MISDHCGTFRTGRIEAIASAPPLIMSPLPVINPHIVVNDITALIISRREPNLIFPQLSDLNQYAPNNPIESTTRKYMNMIPFELPTQTGEAYITVAKTS